METESIRVRMLGEFSVGIGEREISDRDNRSKKAWLLLAYLIYCRDRDLQPEELADLLWGDAVGSSNPLNALKTMLHRVRAMLGQLGEDAGYRLIIRRSGSYAWNTDIPMELDIDQFERLRQRGPDQSEDDWLEQSMKALSLYRGDFLDKLSAERWVAPISAYFHGIYVQLLLETLPLLEERSRQREAAMLCRTAVELEPYDQEIYRHLLRNLLDLGEQQEVLRYYDVMSQRILDQFGLLPAPDLRAMQREALRVVNDRAISFDTVVEQLKEPGVATKALFCEYDFFKIIYQAEARSIVRSGDAVHLALLTVSDRQGACLPKRSQERAMENLKELVLDNLRRGDIVSQCSVAQFIILLPQATYENSRAVCERVVKTFARQYPHSPATLHYAVQPLEPNGEEQ